MKKRTLVSLLLALCLVVSLMPMTLAEELPTLTVMMMNNGRTWDPTTSNNAKIQEIIGAKLDMQLVDGDAMTLSISSGDLADILVLSKMDYAEYVNTGYLIPLDALLAEHGGNITALTTELGKKLCTVDGVQYVFPYENNNSKYFTYLRNDWLKNLNIDLGKYPQIEGSDIYQIPLADYAQMLEAFTFNDPDGNGKNDTYGMSFYGEFNPEIAFMNFFGAFGGQMTQSYEKDGKVWAFETTDEYRAALEYIKTLWDKGVMDPELFILKGDQAKAGMMNGKAGSFVGWWSTGYEFIRDGMWDLQAGTEWATAEIIGADGKAGMRDNGRIGNTVAITSSCKDPVFAMKVLNKLNEESVWWMIRYGLEGEHYNLDQDGYPIRTEAGTKIFEGMTLDTLYPLTNCIDYENFCNSAYPTDEKLLIRRGMLVHQFVKEFKLYTDLFYGMPKTQESMDYAVDVTNTVKTAVMQFVTGAKELNDANWEAYLKNWSSMGGSDILKSYVDAYNTQNATGLVPAM